MHQQQESCYIIFFLASLIQDLIEKYFVDKNKKNKKMGVVMVMVVVLVVVINIWLDVPSVYLYVTSSDLQVTERKKKGVYN